MPQETEVFNITTALTYILAELITRWELWEPLRREINS